MQHDEDGNVVEVGARTRTIPPALRRALQHRDKGCRFPGCGIPFGQGHHVRHWAHGGPTTLSNLALLCRRHHRAVHEEGYQVERQPDGALQFRCPNGQPLPDVPPPGKVPANPVEVLRDANVANGIQIHARTACATWLGEPLNVGWAIDVLHPLAAAPRCLISAHTKAGGAPGSITGNDDGNGSAGSLIDTEGVRKEAPTATKA
jgi:hypothetical protein